MEEPQTAVLPLVAHCRSSSLNNLAPVTLWLSFPPPLLSVPLLKPQVFSGGGCKGELVILTYHQYAALMSPNKGETAVCGSSNWYVSEEIKSYVTNDTVEC